MKKIITLAIIAICAMSMSAQKYIDYQNVVWSFGAEYEQMSADNRNGLEMVIDSLGIGIRPMYTGLIEFTITNNGHEPATVIWDESTLDSKAIVFGDMRMYQIGSSIKPSIVESNSVVMKEITTEWCAQNHKPYVDLKADKDVFKQLGYMIYPMTIYLCVERDGNKTRHKISLEGNYIGKKFKNKDVINKTQDFTEIDKLIYDAKNK